MPDLAALLRKNSGCPETLGNIHVMPVNDAGIPSSHVLVNPLRQPQKPGFTRSVIHPINRLNVVPEPQLRPVAAPEICSGLPIQPSEVAGEERNNPRILRVFAK